MIKGVVAMLQEKAVLVRLSISTWTARKYDKRVTEKVDQEFGAHDAGRYNKILIAQDAIKAYMGIANEARGVHYDLTLPWGNNGDRLLPVGLVDQYRARMEGFKDRFQEQVSLFVQGYDSLVGDARERLNGMFNPDDYPSMYLIAGRFGFDFNFFPVPAAGHFVVDVQESVLNEFKEKLVVELQDLESQAMRDVWERIYFTLARMVERLSKAEAVFRDSLIGNVQEILTIAGALNFKRDEKIITICQRISDMIAGVSPDTLRSSRRIREQVSNAGMLVLNEVGRELGLNPLETIRKIRLEKEGDKKAGLKDQGRAVRVA